MGFPSHRVQEDARIGRLHIIPFVYRGPNSCLSRRYLSLDSRGRMAFDCTQIVTLPADSTRTQANC